MAARQSTQDDHVQLRPALPHVLQDLDCVVLGYLGLCECGLQPLRSLSKHIEERGEN